MWMCARTHVPACQTMGDIASRVLSPPLAREASGSAASPGGHVVLAAGSCTNSQISQSSPRARPKTPVIIPHTERDVSRSAATARSPMQQPQRTQLVGAEGSGGGTLQRTRHVTRSAAPPGEESQQPQRTQLVGEEGSAACTLQHTRRNVTRSAATPPGEEGQQPQRTQLVGEGSGGGTLQRTRRNVTRSAATPPARENLMMQPPRSRTALAGEEGLAGGNMLPRAADYLNQEGWSLVTSPEAFSPGGPHFRSSCASPLFHIPLRRLLSL